MECARRRRRSSTARTNPSYRLLVAQSPPLELSSGVRGKFRLVMLGEAQKEEVLGDHSQRGELGGPVRGDDVEDQPQRRA